MRIRMLKDLSTKRGDFKAGQTYELEDVSARSWIGFKLAEEDKALDGPPETKVERGVTGHVAGPNVTLEVLQGTSRHPVPPPGFTVPVKRELVGKVAKKKK